MPDTKEMIDTVLPWSAAASSVTNPLFAHLTNVKNRKFTREMYKTQRKDALSDWEMQNEYNSPRAQMQRYQEAGLNPHLIYGQSNEGATVRSSSASGGSAEAPRFETGELRSSLMAGYDMRMRSAQTDLVAKQISIAEQEALLKEAQIHETTARTGQILKSTERSSFDLELERDSRDVSLQSRELNAEKTRTEIGVMLDANERAAAMNSKSIEEMTQRIIAIRKGVELTGEQIVKIKEEINLLRKEGRIKELDAQLADRGIRPGDSPMFRYIGGIIEGIYRKLFGGRNEESGSESQQPGETIEQWKKRRAIGKHK